MAVNWVLIANKSETRILQAQKERADLELVSVVKNEKARLKESEINSDSPGATVSSTTGTGGRSLTHEYSAVEHALEVYTHDIADLVTKGKDRHEFDKIVLVAEPGYLGVLGKEFERRKLPVVATVAKELSHMKDRDLAHSLREDLLKTFPLG